MKKDIAIGLYVVATFLVAIVLMEAFTRARHWWETHVFRRFRP